MHLGHGPSVRPDPLLFSRSNVDVDSNEPSSQAPLKLALRFKKETPEEASNDTTVSSEAVSQVNSGNSDDELIATPTMRHAVEIDPALLPHYLLWKNHPFPEPRIIHVSNAISALKALVEFIFDNTMYTIHHPAVGIALREPHHGPMRDYVNHSLQNLMDTIRNGNQKVLDVILCEQTRRRLLDEFRCPPRIPPMAIHIDPRIPDIVLYLRPRLASLYSSSCLLPYRSTDYLAMPGTQERHPETQKRSLETQSLVLNLGLLGEHAHRVMDALEHKIGEAHNSVLKIAEETDRLQWMLKHLTSAPKQ